MTTVFVYQIQRVDAKYDNINWIIGNLIEDLRMYFFQKILILLDLCDPGKICMKDQMQNCSLNQINRV